MAFLVRKDKKENRRRMDRNTPAKVVNTAQNVTISTQSDDCVSQQISKSLFGVLSEKQAYKVARNLLKDFALECIAAEATRQNLSPSIRQKVQAKALCEISKQTENFSTHWGGVLC